MINYDYPLDANCDISSLFICVFLFVNHEACSQQRGIQVAQNFSHK